MATNECTDEYCSSWNWVQVFPRKSGGLDLLSEILGLLPPRCGVNRELANIRAECGGVLYYVLLHMRATYHNSTPEAVMIGKTDAWRICFFMILS